MSEAHDIPALADEYVLGLLDPAEEAEVEARIEREPLLRAAVGAARDRFLELDLAGRAAVVPPALWERIAADLGTQPATVAGAHAARMGVAAASGSANAPAKGSANDNMAARWRGRALAGLVASLVLATGLGFSLLARPAPVVVAVLLDASGEPQALVEDFGNEATRVTPLVDFAVPEGRTLQVWTLPSAERGPVSLGLLAEARSMMLDGPDLPAPKAEQLYEITLEQEGGSPSGRPTGPILVNGFAKVPR